jgi:hypothetical protein
MPESALAPSQVLKIWPQLEKRRCIQNTFRAHGAVSFVSGGGTLVEDALIIAFHLFATFPQ